MKGKTFTELLKAVLERDKSLRFSAKGFSMAPFIKDGDVITVSPLKYLLPRTGDIVAFIHPKSQKLIIHRIIQKKNNAYVMAGDNIAGTDGLVLKQNILGRVTKLERAGKKISLGLGVERYLIALSRRNQKGAWRFLKRGLALFYE